MFVIDTGVFIQAKQTYYAFDIAPRFWELLIEANNAGKIESIDRVQKELIRGKDDLARWAKDDFSDAFKSTDRVDVATVYGQIINWVRQQARFSRAEIARFARGADGWLIAYAKITDGIVVTHEGSEPTSNRVKIPDVCQQFGVTCTSPFRMLRELGVKWTT
jgi:hypothetical protein